MSFYKLRIRGTTGQGRGYEAESVYSAAAEWWEDLRPWDRFSGTYALEVQTADGPWVPFNLLVDIQPVFRLLEVEQ